MTRGPLRQRIGLESEELDAFCRRWRVRRLSAFGSVLGDGFRSDSDLDLLVSFTPDAPWSMLDLVRVRDELVRSTGREVDLIEEEALAGSRNYIRRRAIQTSAKVIYALG